MIDICVSESKFRKCLGYGLWSLMTFGIILLMVANIIEENNMIEVDHGHAFKDHCTMSILNDWQFCVSWWDFEDKSTRNDFYMIGYFMKSLLILDIIGISIWVYCKKPIFNFSWCSENNTTLHKKPLYNSDGVLIDGSEKESTESK